MGADVVVTTEETPDPTGAAYAAGVAASTAAQAAQEAQEASNRAEIAQMDAQEATEAAYDARSAVESLRGEFTAQLEELRQGLGVVAAVAVEAAETAEAGAVDDVAPEPVEETPEASAEQPKDDGPPKEKRWGNDGWFGSR